MTPGSAATEAVVRHHLEAFLEQCGVAAVVAGYDPEARFYTETQVYQGQREISAFFTSFFEALPDGAVDRFALRSLQVEEDVALLTWSVGDEIPLGTDTFIVRDDKIALQTFAMHAVPRADPGPTSQRTAR